MSARETNEHLWHRARMYHKHGVHAPKATPLDNWRNEFRCWVRAELERVLAEHMKKHYANQK